MLRDVVGQGTSKFWPMKYLTTWYVFPRATLMLRGKARKTEAFPGQPNCNVVMVMLRTTSGKVCRYRHTRPPGLMPTRRRSLGGQGAPSPRLVVMP